jgi:DNA polymerase-1
LTEIKKVFHNFSFDRHVLANHGIKVQGFAGDTMHMARLWYAGLRGIGAYSLESLTHNLLQNRVGKKSMKVSLFSSLCCFRVYLIDVEEF